MKHDFSVQAAVRRNILIVSIIIVLLVLALYYIPCTEYIEIRSTCTEVDREGMTLSEGEFVLEGIYYKYLFQQDMFKLTELRLPNIEILGSVEFDSGTPEIMFGPTGTDFIWIPCGLTIPRNNGKLDEIEHVFGTISTYSDFQQMVIRIGDTNTSRFFVFLGQSNSTPGELLNEFGIN